MRNSVKIFLVICSVCALTACSDDDDNGSVITLPDSQGEGPEPAPSDKVLLDKIRAADAKWSDERIEITVRLPLSVRNYSLDRSRTDNEVDPDGFITMARDDIMPPSEVRLKVKPSEDGESIAVKMQEPFYLDGVVTEWATVNLVFEHKGEDITETNHAIRSLDFY